MQIVNPDDLSQPKASYFLLTACVGWVGALAETRHGWPKCWVYQPSLPPLKAPVLSALATLYQTSFFKFKNEITAFDPVGIVSD